MTIEITKPEVEALIQQRLRTGGFADPEDVILQALRAFEPAITRSSKSNLVEVCAIVQGLSDDLDIVRNQSSARAVNLE